MAALVLAGCASGTAVDATAPTNAPTADPTLPPGFEGATEVDPAMLQPLRGLGPCTVEPNEMTDAPAEGLLVPPGTILTEQSSDGPLTTVKGYLPMTPVQVRVWYQLQPEATIVQVEDEVRESETLLDHGEHRLFVKAQAICESGSVFLVVVAPQVAEDQVPAPAGAGGAG